MKTSRIRLAEKNHIATITLSRPDRRNAFDDEMLTEFVQVFDDLATKNLRTVILTGAENASFSAGYDITCIDPNQPLDQPLPDMRFEKIIRAVNRCEVPVIAAMNGDAYGGGLDLALACDFRIASSGIKVGMTPVRLGLVYCASGLARFIARLGPGTARRLFLPGNPLQAEEAHRLGIIDEIVDPTMLMTSAVKLATDIAAGAPLAILGTRKTIQYLEQSLALRDEQKAELDELRSAAFSSHELHTRLEHFHSKVK
jgi:enoyl-CoA hydratase